MTENNTTSVAIERHLKEFQGYLCGFLGEILPKICVGGADWWTLLVRSIPRLKGSQSSRIRSGTIRDLGKLDLVSLCGVLKHNWRSICEKKEIDDQQRVGALQCDTLINLRNTLSHLGADTTLNLEDSLSALLSIKKLSQLLGTTDDFITSLDQDLQAITLIMSGGGAPPVPPKTPDSEAPPQRGSQDRPIAPREDPGIPLGVLACEGEIREELEAALSLTTFVGIDFGTSTTIASRVFLDPVKGILATEAIPIPQLDRMGRTIEDHLLPSCVAWHDGRLLIGQGAAELKPECTRDQDVWFSFKMELGIDLGPKYVRSKLNGKDGTLDLRRPQDVAATFFDYLKKHIEQWVAERGRPTEIRYAVSVPASFEANQRLDLCSVMKRAGINVEDSSIIDEPNAAFISYLLDSLANGDGVLKSYQDQKRNALVFDFGAGTCDISILNVGCVGEKLVSRNLAISQFRALGGDNIDRQIARKILWPAMQRASLGEDDHMRSVEFEQGILPRLQTVGEELKVQCSKLIASRAQGGDVSIYRTSEERVKAASIPPISIRGHNLHLAEPSISLKEFYEIMDPFLSMEVPSDESEAICLLEPIESALAKAGLQKDQLDMVLFIGGSAQNPLVQDAIRTYFGRHVECEIGADIRSPVSRGAALHSLTWNGLEMQFIRPITSETIYILTAGNALHPVIPAGTPIPTPEVLFTDSLIVPNDNQEKVELPICVSTSTKVLHILELNSPDDSPFQGGDRITISAFLDQNKLLHITAKLGNTMAKGALVNPLSNEELSPEETKRLIARQKLNESIVKNGGRPSAAALKAFADACAKSGAHLEAAESLESLERIDPKHLTGPNATQICYQYSCCGKHSLSDQWAEKAHSRQPTWVSAFNLALTMERSSNEDRAMELFEEANQLSDRNPVVMAALGDRLLTRNKKERGREMLREANELFREMLNHGSLQLEDVGRAIRLASFLNDQEFLTELGKYESKLSKKSKLYAEEFLAVSIKNENLTR